MSSEKREKITNPPGFVATQDLKNRGWTPTLIARFLGEHDQTRPNGLKMGGKRLPPVKLYREERVNEVENNDTFLAAQAKAADARERAAQNKATREAKRVALLERTAEGYVPLITPEPPEPLRKGSTRKAREPYLKALEQEQRRLEHQIAAEGKSLNEGETVKLRTLLLERLDTALSLVYDWFPRPGKARAKAASNQPAPNAKPSDWREWDWD